MCTELHEGHVETGLPLGHFLSAASCPLPAALRHQRWGEEWMCARSAFRVDGSPYLSTDVGGGTHEWDPDLLGTDNLEIWPSGRLVFPAQEKQPLAPLWRVISLLLSLCSSVPSKSRPPLEGALQLLPQSQVSAGI